MNDDLLIEKIQLAEVDPDKKYLVMVKMDDNVYGDPSYFESVGNRIVDAMERLGCKRENISVVFGFEMQIMSITTDETKPKGLSKRIEALEAKWSEREYDEWQRNMGEDL